MSDVDEPIGVLPRVLISYAHESPEHVQAVRELWTFLRNNGVDAKIDLSAANRRRDWTLWMMREICQADFVIVIASPEYKRRAEGDAPPDEGRGVQFEGIILRNYVMENLDVAFAKILPVLLPGRTIADIPVFLGPVSGTHYPVRDLTVAGTEELLRVLLNRPRDVEGPIGPAPDFLSAGVRQRHEIVVAVRIEDGQLVTSVTVSGSSLGEHTSSLTIDSDPWGMRQPTTAAALDQQVRAGYALSSALFSDATRSDLVRLIDNAPFGTVADVSFVTDAATSGLPFELLRLPDGRLFATLPMVRVTRRLSGVDCTSTPALAGPLKILVAVAAPDETRTKNRPLGIEAEMQAVVEAIGVIGQSGGQVTILEVSGPEQIAQALAKNQYHILHLSAHGSPMSVELEDEDGNPVEVGAQELVDRLRETGRQLPLIVLSSCAGAAAGTYGLAAALIRGRADRVVAMQTAVTDGYATRLAAALYEALVKRSGVTVAEALADARRALERQRVAAERRGEHQRPESSVPTLLACGVDVALWDPAAPPDPLSAPAVIPAGQSIRDLPLGYLIGRRSQLRDALGILRNTDKARALWGARPGVVLTGVGGIGKTALAGRLISRMREGGTRIVVHEGRWNPQKLFEELTEAYQDQPNIAAALMPGVDDGQRLHMLARLVNGDRLLLVFDDFEQNLEVGGGQFLDAGFAETFAQLCAAAVIGRVLVTCRYPLPDDLGHLAKVAVSPMTSSELSRMLLRLPKLQNLSAANRRVIERTIGGHPRLLEFVDALLRNGDAYLLVAVTTKLRGLAQAENIDVTTPRDVEQAVTDAILAGSRDIVLDQLVELLADEEREVLLQAAVSLASLTVDHLALARHGVDPTEDQRREVRAAVKRLLDLTLISRVDEIDTLISRVDEIDILVHPWVSEALRSHQSTHFTARHARAADMRLGLIQAGQVTLENLSETGRHLAASGQTDTLVGFAISIGEANLGELNKAALLGEMIPAIRADHPGYPAVVDREATALQNIGNSSAAKSRYIAITEIIKIKATADEGNVQLQRDLSISYERLGDLAVAAGEVAEARRLFGDSLTIARRLATADEGNVQLQRDLSISYERLGDLAVAAGEVAEARRLFGDSLTIRRRLATADEGNVQLQRDLSVSYNKLGDLAVAAGEVAEARRLFGDSLTIARRLATADEGNVQLQRDLSVSYNKLGDLAVAAGEVAEARRLFGDSLTIRRRLATADEGNVQLQRDLSVSYNKLGDLAVAAGEVAEARRLFGDSLTIARRLATADEGNVQLQRDLSVSYNKLGDLAVAAGEVAEARRLFGDSLTIRRRLATADEGNVQLQRDLSISYNKLGDLAVAAGEVAEARRLFGDSLTIARRLATADEGNVQLQRDLSISYERLGDLAVAAGEVAEARRLFGDSLTIARRLATADEGNVQLQRDLSVSYNKLGDLAVAAGEVAEARRLFGDSLTIRRRLATADEGNVQLQRDLSISYERLGDLAVAAGEVAEARRLFGDSLTIARRLATADEGNVQLQRDLSVSYNKLGDLAVAAGEVAEARRLFGDSLTIRRRLATADEGNVQLQRDLSISYERLGDLAVAAGEVAEARRLFGDSLTIARRLATADEGNVQLQRDLSVSYNKLGDLAVAAGEVAEARRLFGDSLTIARRLATADEGNVQLQRDLSISYERLGDLAVAAGEVAEARRLFGDAGVIRERLRTIDPANVQWRRDLAYSYERLAAVATALGDAEEAERIQAKADELRAPDNK